MTIRSGSEIGQVRLDAGVGKAGIDVHVQLIDNLGWRAPGHYHTVPGARLVSWHKFADRWDVGERL